MIRKKILNLLPQSIRAPLQAMAGSFRSYKILPLQYGQFQSMHRGSAIDKNKEAIPWFTYPAIEYLKQLDLSDKTIFEYGSGNSTIFWSKLCKKLVSIEDDQQWYKKIKSKLHSDVSYNLYPDKKDYIESINNYPEKFDIIIIDGNHRYQCAIESLKKLKDDGFIILDNSDWANNISKNLRDADLIEVDMTGFTPIGPFTATTSFFFTRNVKLKPVNDRQPIHGIGSMHWSDVWSEYS